MLEKMTDNSKEEFSKYIPQHPLPDEVREMKRDETVCKFCGVSYLIHNEIKALEDKLKAVEKELEHYKGSEKREEALKLQLNSANNEIEKIKQDLVGRDAVIGTLKNDLKAAEEEKDRIQVKKSEVEDKLQEMTVDCEKYKLKHSFLYNKLPSFISNLQQQREVLSDIKDTVSTRDQVFKEKCQKLQQVTVQVCTEQGKELESSRSRLIELENERLTFKAKEDRHLSDVKNYEAQINELRTKSSDNDALQKQSEQLHASNKELETEILSVQEKNRQLVLESKQYQDQIRRQSEENEQIQSQYRHREQTAQQHLSKIEREFKEKDNELQTVVRELGRMKTKFTEQQEELERYNNLSNLKSKAMHEEMVRAKGDLEALKSEREMMITAHQNQIEQLRESFKKKIAQTEMWPEKLDEVLKKERDKHNTELALLEQKLKESFVYEMQIEKQKQKELTEKYVSEVKESEEGLRNQLNNVDNKHKKEVSELHKQLAEYKARSRETENSLRQEIGSLKKIIADLEQRLSRFDSGSDEKVTELKFEIKKMENETTELRQEKKKLEGQLASAKEEVGFLQETVRRECEERFELTEALSQVKEDLLQFKRPPGGYSSSTHSRTPDNSSSVISPSSEELTLFKKVARPHPPRESKDKDVANTNNVLLGYEGDSARTTPRSRSVKGGNLTDSRKRIAQAVGRKS